MTRKESIVNTYLNLGEQKGFANVSLSDIAAKENISKASLFSHFTDFSAIRAKAIQYCQQFFEKTEFKINLKAADKEEYFESLINGLIATFSAFPISAYLAMIDQQKSYDSYFSDLSDKINLMISARLTVALDYTNQRMWTNIRDTDLSAVILTQFVRSIRDGQNAQDLMDYLLSC